MNNQTMKPLTLLSLVACLFAVQAAFAQSPDENAERKRFVGLWKGFAVEGKGENPNRGPVQIELTISETTIKGLQIRKEGNVDHGEGTYALDLKANPRVLDGTKTNERGRKDSWLGIYRLEGDTLYWCVAKKQHPTTFETVKGQFLLILKRAAK
jgi:uncharacterized protein (TIGR03067 family)